MAYLDAIECEDENFDDVNVPGHASKLPISALFVDID